MGSEAETATRNIASGGLQNISEKQLVLNPFVMKVMERIAALEGCQGTVQAEVAAVTAEKMHTKVPEGDVSTATGVNHTGGMEVSETW